MTQVKIIRGITETEIEYRINEFCTKYNVVDIKFIGDQELFHYTAMIIYKVGEED